MYTVDTQYVLNMDLYQYLCCWNIINFQRNMFLCFVSNGKDVRLFTLLVWGNIHKMVYTTIIYVAKRAMGLSLRNILALRLTKGFFIGLIVIIFYTKTMKSLIKVPHVHKVQHMF